jgi:hypothetical protein
MIFTLEALQAAKGDSLILHFGESKSPRFIVIDGGPAGVYGESLKPRLGQLHDRWKREDDGKLDVEMLMVSHIDDDHIQGVLDWVGELADADPLLFNLLTIWHNSFDDVVGNASVDLQSRLASLTAEVVETQEDREGLQPLSGAVLAAVGQGRKLRSMANQLGIPLNHGFQGLVSSLKQGKTTLSLGSGLTFTVLSPTMERLEALQKEWEKVIKTLPAARTAEIAAFVDRSATNLSSIVVLAECGGRRMLLTGDARGDHILEGLDRAGLMTDGKIHVDLFKLPHHGSNRNSAPEFFQRITADYYVISADGENENPDAEIFEWISKARGADKYTIYLTNRDMVDPKTHKDVGAAMRKSLDDNPAPGRSVVYRAEQEPLVRVDLGEKIDY